MRHPVLKTILGVGLALSLAGALAVSAGPPPLATPVAVTSEEGLFVVSLPANQPSVRVPRPKSRQKAEQGAEALLKSLVNGEINAAIGRGDFRGKTKRITTAALSFVLQKLREQIVGVGVGRPGTQAVGDGNLNVLAAAAGVTVDGLASDEALTVGYAVAGEIYSTQLNQQRLVAGSGGTTIQIDYSTPPTRDNLDGSLFAALIRDSEVSDAGVLIVAVLDSQLPTLLAPLGAVNADTANAAVTIPYEITLTGSASGEHQSQAPSFDDLYFAKQGVMGIGVPAPLAPAAQKLLDKVR